MFDSDSLSTDSFDSESLEFDVEDVEPPFDGEAGSWIIFYRRRRA